MKLSAKQIIKIISEKMPEGSVITDHDETGHYYKIMTPDKNGIVGNRYPSVTGKIQILKDESLINYKMNQAVQYVFKKWTQFNESNIMEHLELATRASADILSDAGDIGREIHDAREKYFQDWIKTGIRPADILSYITPENSDIRMISALRALQDFCIDYEYVPVATELFVYSHDLRVAGTLDDIGLMKKVVKEGDKNCAHNIVGGRCLLCDYKQKTEFVLMDIKTSNQFKDHYFFQVALYWRMFSALTGLRPERSFILKLSKNDGTYKFEDLKKPAKLALYSKNMIKTNEGIAYIRQLRKDNQKKVGEILQI